MKLMLTYRMNHWKACSILFRLTKGLKLELAVLFFTERCTRMAHTHEKVAQNGNQEYLCKKDNHVRFPPQQYTELKSNTFSNSV